MKRYPLDLRRRIVKARKQDGATMRSVTQTFQVNTNTVLAWVKLERETGNVKPYPQKGGVSSQLKGKNYS